MPLRDVLGLSVTHIHMVWGYVCLTGIAAAVSPGFHSPEGGRDQPQLHFAPSRASRVREETSS